jgi:hypothetical protein
VARILIAYKFLKRGGIAPFTGFRWPVERWVEAASVETCRGGIHACRVQHLPIWMGAELWEIELDGDVVEQTRKVVAARGRLTRRIDEWNEELLERFGKFCIGRTRKRVGFLPVTSGYVADVERFVAQRRFAIAGFAAARAAERRDGPAGYDLERSLQAAWLAEQLGLEKERGPSGRARARPRLVRLRLRIRLLGPHTPRVPDESNSCR